MAGLAASTAGAATDLAPGSSLRPVARGKDLRRRFLATPEELIARAKLGGSVSYAVLDSQSGKVLETHGTTALLPPASVAKALTAAYALDALGASHRFETQLLVTAPVENGITAGDLILVGGADPTLDTDALAGLAARLKDSGLREVRGDFLVWGGALPYVRTIDEGQPEVVGYSPAVSGLNLNFNRVHFEWRRAGGAYSVTMDARSEQYRPDVRVARMRVADRAAPVYTYADGETHDAWTVAKGALGQGGARWLPVRKPELYAGEVFQTFAQAHGIVLKPPRRLQQTAAPVGQRVAVHQSASMRRILRDMLKFSTNITAEAVGMAATAASVGRPANLAASAEAMNAWARTAFGLRDVALVDHSGLGDASRIGSADMAKALLALRTRQDLKSLMKGFPMRDAKRRVIENHPIKVHAKTGTLNFVSGLAGYADLEDGSELVFAIFTGDLDRRAGLTKAERERPEGAVGWNRRAKGLQQALIERWAVMYSS